MKTVRTHPIDVGGRLVTFLLHYDNRDLVNGWDIVYRGYRINKVRPAVRAELGVSDSDLSAMNARAAEIVDAQEGRILGSSGYA